MTTPKQWTPGDKITAERLNVAQQEALRSRREVALGNGSSLVNETLANQSAHMQKGMLKLMSATEDFAVPETATDLKAGALDTVSSGLCQMLRINRSTGPYEEETLSPPFRVWDVIGSINDGATRVTGEAFYAGYNQDSKRWEIIGSAGIRLQAAHVIRCLGRGWHEIELCQWDGRPIFPESFSVSDSVSESCENDVEAVAGSHCRMPCEYEPCETLDDGTVQMDDCLQAGEQIHYPLYAHTTRQLPMLTGGLIKVIRRFGTPVGQLSLSESGSNSASESADDPWYYDVVDGVWPIKQIVSETYATCVNATTGECTVIRTSHSRLLVEGYSCPTVMDEQCFGPESSSASEPS